MKNGLHKECHWKIIGHTHRRIDFGSLLHMIYKKLSKKDKDLNVRAKAKIENINQAGVTQWCESGAL